MPYAEALVSLPMHSFWPSGKRTRDGEITALLKRQEETRASTLRRPSKLRNVAVEFTFLREILFLLWRHFRRILTTRYTARSELSASDLVLCEPFLIGIIARHLSPPHCLSALRQSMDDHWPGNRCSWSSEQRRKALLDPRQCSFVRLFGSRIIFENTDRCHGVVGCIDYVVGHKALDITDDRDRSLLDPARQLLSHSGLCLTLTDRSVHGSLPPRGATTTC